MRDARAKFRELTRVFDPIYQPRLAAADGPGASYVPDTHADYRRQLEVALDFNDHTKLLVAGQPGRGKTTLLLSLAVLISTSAQSNNIPSTARSAQAQVW